MLVAALCAGTSLWNLGDVGYGRHYLSAAARSMSLNWRNFLYASFDPGSGLSVEKPPLPLWVQASLVRLFGLNTYSLIVPSVVCAVLLAWVFGSLVARHLGRGAASWAGVGLAFTPGVYALSRSNYADIYVLLFCVLAAYCSLRACESEPRKWLSLAALALGAGYMSKNLYAYQVLPAVVLTYVWFSPQTRRAKLIELTRAGVLLAVSSFSWTALCEFTNRQKRPFIAHTKNSSVLEQSLNWSSLNGPFQPAGNPPGYAGAPGPLRIFSAAGDQAHWFSVIALVVIGIFVVRLVRSRHRTEALSEPRSESAFVLLFSTWFLCNILVFSFTGRVVHDYYAASAAPAAVALAAYALHRVSGMRAQRRRTAALSGFVLCAALTATLYVQRVSHELATYHIAAALTALVGCSFGLVYVAARQSRGLWIVAFSLLVVPASFAVNSTLQSFDEWNPVGRPGEQYPALTDPIAPEIYTYAETHRDGETWVFAVGSYADAEIGIVHGHDLLAGEGFSGYTQYSFTVQRLTQFVADGELRYVMLGGIHEFPDEVVSYVHTKCIPVLTVDPAVLYDCQKAAN